MEKNIKKTAYFRGFQALVRNTRHEGVVSSSLISGFLEKQRNPSEFKGLRFFLVIITDFIFRKYVRKNG